MEIGVFLSYINKINSYQTIILKQNSKKMKTTTKFILAVAMFLPLINIAQINSRGEAINKAGMQRMYAMKMAKNYMAIGAGIKVAEANKELEETSTSFNENYNDLMIYAKTKELKDALASSGIVWNKFREKVNETSTKDDASGVISEAYNLLNSCNVVVDKLVVSNGGKLATLQNICGKQRALSQKLGLLYIAKVWQVPYSTLGKELNETLTTFENSLSLLTLAPENTEEINTILKLQQSEWNFTKKSFDINAEKLSPISVYSSTNLMTRNYESATGLYEKLVF